MYDHAKPRVRRSSKQQSASAFATDSVDTEDEDDANLPMLHPLRLTGIDHRQMSKAELQRHQQEYCANENSDSHQSDELSDVEDEDDEEVEEDEEDDEHSSEVASSEEESDHGANPSMHSSSASTPTLQQVLRDSQRALDPAIYKSARLRSLKAAAMQGDESSMHNLGVVFERGVELGAKQNLAAALYWVCIDSNSFLIFLFIFFRIFIFPFLIALA